MRGLGKALLCSAAFAACVALACSYQPEFDDGTLQCSPDGRCPQGYACRVTTCWKVVASSTGAAGTTGVAGTRGGAGTTGAAGTTGVAGTTGAAGNTGAAGTSVLMGSATNFPGHWLYQAGSVQTINCLDGSMDSKPLGADYLDITKTGAVTLKGNYYCDWNLTLDATLTKTAIVPNQSCQTMATATNGTVSMYLWKGTKFVFTTLDGLTATLQAEISTDYTSTTTANVKTSGTCALKISGTLLKATAP